MVSPSLIAQLRAELMRYVPFARMEPAQVDALVAAAEQLYFAPGEAVLAPEDGVVQHLHCIRSGAVVGQGGAAPQVAGVEYDPGDLFPVGALLAERAVTARYHAVGDTFCLRVPAATVKQIAEASGVFADFLNARVMRSLDYSRRALQVAYSAQTLSEHSLERPLAEFARRTPVTVGPETPLAEALARMHDKRIGSVLVVDAGGAAAGILTRHDILGRVTLPQLPLATPIAQVMSAPVHTLPADASAQDAVLVMSRRGIRHVPVTEGGGGARVVGIVSERDLFAMQRLSINHVGTSIRHADDVATLVALAGETRRLARNLLGQGVGARQLTELISRLNDLLTERIVTLIAADCGVDRQRMCWLAFGSEGRSEQTVATDQDNGLVFTSDDPGRDRPAWLAFARRVNEALDACGFPLCRGNVMAGNPECCLTADEWCARFAAWIEQGAPSDLLAASIYFDLRPLIGRHELAAPMRELVTQRAAGVPRFVKQLADNALMRAPPLNWRGGLDSERIDLKLQGTAIFVDAARLYALAHGIPETNTRRRFEAAVAVIGLPANEGEAWVGGFEYLQMLRLRTQLDGVSLPERPNELDVATLNDIDRRVLKESLRIARRLQQRLELDYRR
jgi:CBS domain-containing protein